MTPEDDRRIALIGIVAILVPILAFFVWLLVEREAYLDDVEAFNLIELGENREQLIAKFGRAPEFELRFSSLKVLYYWPKGLSFENGPKPNVFEITDKNLIPWSYGAFQILLDPDGVVSATAWNGEKSAIETLNGEVYGSTLSELSEEYFESLIDARE